ncbi:divalent cation tolerance protein [Micromonospora matsumotoense]|uniref:Divalent cation tolerance protein n=1 Tax=Micromonospora matsumotoense TaxID=121616 RepID=A0A1C5AXR6_9ACTN|nr:divalent-cation tolerance protein CutA [Micromonospora matsumotoense]SCF50019.1 divalent cation tolerance protein [Micromonospora matsumotoense]
MADYQHAQAVTTTDSRDAAEALARSAVEARVAACAQVSGPISSTYWWEGQVENAEEWYVVFKTTAERYAALEEHIREHHTYDVPEVVLLPILAGNPAYLAWVSEETAPRS